MAQAMTLLGAITGTATTTTVSFVNIPQSFRDLRLVVTWVAGSVVGSDQIVQLNGDTTNTYLTVEMSGDGTTAASYSFTKTGLYLQYLSSTATNGQKSATFDLMDYSATDKHKTSLNRASNANWSVDARASRWPNTAAVTSLAVVSVSSTFAAGSTFYLYGIAG